MHRFRKNLEIMSMTLGICEHVCGGRLPGKKQDLAFGIFLAEPHGQLDSGHPRHDYIRDQQVGCRTVGCSFQGPKGIFERGRGKARLREDHRQRLSDQFLVVYDENNSSDVLHLVAGSLCLCFT